VAIPIETGEFSHIEYEKERPYLRPH
jgi:hypothetical protein